MSTYDHKKLLLDYGTERMTVETAMGHTLQHVDKLYELQTAANLSRYGLRDKVDTLEHKIFTLQTKIDRLTSLVEEVLPKTSDKQQKELP